VLRIAYSHAIMHANRFFLLGNFSRSETQVEECVMAAKTVLEIVDGLARDSPIFHAFWWTHYVAFCALVVTYAWEIQQQTQYDASFTSSKSSVGRALLLDLAERCQTHLARATATNSPSRRYAIILEELRSEAQQRSGRGAIAGSVGRQHGAPMAGAAENGSPVDRSPVLRGSQPAQPFYDNVGDVDGHSFQPGILDPVDGFGALSGNPIFESWNMSDWLELDSSVRYPFPLRPS
jgi:hypothetical protein